MNNLDNIFINACKNGQKGVVEALVKKGGIQFDKRDATGTTALLFTCIKGARDIAKILLDNGADPMLANNFSITPLHAVSKSGNKDIALMLVERGADVNATDKDGKTPLIYTIMEGRTETAKYLLSHGADKTIKDNNGHNAMNYATAKGLRDLISLLVDTTENTDSFGNTPLHQAVHNNQSEIVATLLQMNVIKIDAINDSGETALLLAAIRSNLLIVEMLLNAKADPNFKLLGGNSALHYAAAHGNRFIGYALINAKAVVNEKNVNGETPLIIAAKSGRNDFTAMLIENDANVNDVDNFDQSALFYASEAGYTEIVEQLIIAGAVV